MKKLILITLVLFVLPLFVKSQTVENVFVDKEIVWFGLDFSHSKMISHEGFSNPDQIVDKFFRSWNNLILKEQDKYDIRKHFRKKKVDYDLSIVTERNDNVDPDELVLDSWETYELPEEKVGQIINEYESDKSGIGLVFIIESFNKTTETGTMYVTFFDIASKEVLFKEKMSGETGGFGFRNHWARTYYNVILECGEKYPQWKRKHLE